MGYMNHTYAYVTSKRCVCDVAVHGSIHVRECALGPTARASGAQKPGSTRVDSYFTRFTQHFVHLALVHFFQGDHAPGILLQ